MSERKPAFSVYDIDQIGKTGRVQDALTLTLEAIKSGTLDDDLFFVGANLAFQIGDLEKAGQLINALLARDPEHAGGWMLFGEIFEARGDTVRADHGRLMAETIFPAIKSIDIESNRSRPIVENSVLKSETNSSITDEEISFDTMTFAEICTRQGYFNKALKIYHDLLKKRPHDPELKRRIDDLTKRINND